MSIIQGTSFYQKTNKNNGAPISCKVLIKSQKSQKIVSRITFYCFQ
jgi:hypothetical protein